MKSTRASNVKTEELLRAALKESREGAVVLDEDNIAKNANKTITTESYTDITDGLIDSLKIKMSYPSILLERLMRSVDGYQLSGQI